MITFRLPTNFDSNFWPDFLFPVQTILRELLPRFFLYILLVLTPLNPTLSPFILSPTASIYFFLNIVCIHTRTRTHTKHIITTMHFHCFLAAFFSFDKHESNTGKITLLLRGKIKWTENWIDRFAISYCCGQKQIRYFWLPVHI